MKMRVLCVLVPLLLVGCGPPRVSFRSEMAASLLFVGDFESGDLDHYGDSQLRDTLRKARVVASPARAGRYALMLSLDRVAHKDMTAHRTDFWIRGMSRKFAMGGDYWYGFSTRLPEAWEADTQGELFAQWVGYRAGGPSLAIYVYGDEYCVKKRWGAGQKDYENLWRGGVSGTKGRWVDWVFHVKWSDGADGFVEGWKDGGKIVSDRGKNCAPADWAPYFKFGIYKWPWKKSAEEAWSRVTRRVLYIDEIRIGEGSAGYDGVAPFGSSRVSEYLE